MMRIRCVRRDTSLLLLAGTLALTGCSNSSAPVAGVTSAHPASQRTAPETIPPPALAGEILRVGKTADVKAALAAQKGKVVVIDFWATY